MGKEYEGKRVIFFKIFLGFSSFFLHEPVLCVCVCQQFFFFRSIFFKGSSRSSSRRRPLSFPRGRCRSPASPPRVSARP